MTDSQFDYFIQNLTANDPAGGRLLKADIIANIIASENLAQVNGATVNVGNGVSGSGTQRIVLASDQSAIPVTFPFGTQTITSSLETNSTNSPVTAGATSVGFATSSDFIGTINGITRLAGEFYGFESSQGKTLPSIVFTVTAGSMTIDKIV